MSADLTFTVPIDVKSLDRRVRQVWIDVSIYDANGAQLGVAGTKYIDVQGSATGDVVTTIQNECNFVNPNDAAKARTYALRLMLTDDGWVSKQAVVGDGSAWYHVRADRPHTLVATGTLPPA
jgi:hypothetical protein